MVSHTFCGSRHCCLCNVHFCRSTNGSSREVGSIHISCPNFGWRAGTVNRFHCILNNSLHLNIVYLCILCRCYFCCGFDLVFDIYLGVFNLILNCYFVRILFWDISINLIQRDIIFSGINTFNVNNTIFIIIWICSWFCLLLVCLDRDLKRLSLYIFRGLVLNLDLQILLNRTSDQCNSFRFCRLCLFRDNIFNCHNFFRRFFCHLCTYHNIRHNWFRLMKMVI